MVPHPIRAHDLEGMKRALAGLREGREVRLAFFGVEGSALSASALQVVEEIEAASGSRIEVDAYELERGGPIARRYRVRRAPCVAVLGPDGDTGVRFYGTLEGIGVTGLIAAIRLAGGADPGLGRGLRKLLARLEEPARMRVFVEPEDPAGPALVRTAAAVALASPELWLDVLNRGDFPAVAHLFGVREPLAAFLGRRSLLATTDEAAFVEWLLCAAGR